MSVIKFRTAANPDDVLEQAVGNFQDVLILGWRKDDETFEARCSADLTDAGLLYLIEIFKHEVIFGADE